MPVFKPEPAAPPRTLAFAIAGLFSLVVFAVGMTVFALLWVNSDSSPRDPETGSAADVPAGGANDQTVGERSAQPGGDFIQAVFADAQTFSPIYATGATEQLVVDLLFPRLLGIDPQSGLLAPTELAEHWRAGPDNRTYTFALRSNLRWSDGAPVTAADFLFTYRALAHPENQSPFRSRAQVIQAMYAPDDFTLVVELAGPSCAALHHLRRPLLPAAHFAPDFDGFSEHPFHRSPTVSAGPFVFHEHTPGAEIVLARNPTYWRGAANLDRYILRIIPQAADQAARLAAGEIDLMALPGEPALAAEAARDAGMVYRYHQPSLTFLAANLADPARPQTGRDAEGRVQAQTPHPLLGDANVRRALALAVDGPGAAGDDGLLLGGYLLPTMTWANPQPPQPLPHDSQAAHTLLDGAGWQAGADGIRRRAGQPLALRLMTNEDNPRRVALAQRIAHDLAQVGVEVRLEFFPFDEMARRLLGQTFDLAVAGWDNLGPDPGLQPFWHSRDDAPGAGFNFTGFQDPEVDEWWDAADATPGCDPDVRGARYGQIQARVQQELPYLLIVGEWDGWVAGPRARNLAPGPWRLYANVHTWGLAPAH